MLLEQFVTDCQLDTLKELSKVCHLAFFYLKRDGVEEFTAAGSAAWLSNLSLAAPNTTRLEQNLKACRDTVKGSKRGAFRLHHTFVKRMEARFPLLSEKSQEVADDGTILPKVLYDKTRGFIEGLAKQINASYEHNIFDGCAVLMRRLEEILLILSYEHLSIGAAIKDANGNYVLLERIVKNAEANATLNLSRTSKKAIEKIRELGNYSAHKVTYTCRREYIEEKIDEFRALVDELLHKAGIRI